MASKQFSDALRTLYSPIESDHPADYVGSRREALDAELAHEVSARSAGATKAQATRRENIKQWQADHAAEIEWINAAADRGFEIARQMQSDINDLGTLTDNRIAKVREWMQKDADRKAARQAERAAAAPVVGNAIKLALETAAQHKAKPELYLTGFTFSLAGNKGANPGAVYVKGDGGLYLGKIAPDGRFFSSRDCPADLIPKIEAAAADPQSAAIAYGKETIRCACCNAKLTNELSRSIGIGPICRANFGW